MNPRPVTNVPAEDVYDAGALYPFTLNDESKNWPLLTFLVGAGVMFKQLDTLINMDQDGNPGWSALLDINRVPVEFLPFLGQFVGVRYLGGDKEAMRDRIRQTDGFKRGSPSAFKNAANRYLTGDKTVYVQERLGGNAYRVGVFVYKTQVPATDLAGTSFLVRDAFLSQKPAGLVMEFTMVDPWSFDTLKASKTDFDAVKNSFATFTDLTNNNPI